MADFQEAYDLVLKNEGGYCNKKGDSGGETYRGVSRNNWPGWPGWPIIDAAKKQVGVNPPVLNKALSINGDLDKMVADFYRRNFWIPNYNLVNSQRIANYIFDKAVNMGTVVIHRLVQKVLDIPTDGIFGKDTLFHLNQEDPEMFMGYLKQAVGQHYEDIAEAHPEDRQFLAGWLERARRG